MCGQGGGAGRGGGGSRRRRPAGEGGGDGGGSRGGAGGGLAGERGGEHATEVGHGLRGGGRGDGLADGADRALQLDHPGLDGGDAHRAASRERTRWEATSSRVTCSAWFASACSARR